MRQAVVGEEGLSAMRFWHTATALAAGYRDELGQVVERVGGDVLELGGHRGAFVAQAVEGDVVVVGGDQVAVGDEAGGLCGSGSSTQTL